MEIAKDLDETRCRSTRLPGGFEPRTARPGGRVLAAGLPPRFYANSLEVVFGSAGSAKSSLQSAMQSALPSAECSPEVLAVQSRD